MTDREIKDRDRDRLPRGPAVKSEPPANEVMAKRWGRVIRCADCFHSYMAQIQPLQPVVRVCACDPPISQLVQTNQGPVIQMVARVVGDENFCHQFKSAVVD
jgi:hypothetical protein